MRVPSSTPGGNVDRERALAGDPAEPAAGGAGIFDDLTAALAGRAGALQGEEALGMADLALAAAGRAGLRLGAGLGAAARAGLAGDRGRDADLGVLAAIGLFEAELHVVAQVGAALAAGAAAAAPGGAAHAEEIVEDVGESRGEVGAEAVAAALLEGGMAEAVIGRALVAVFENLIGLGDFLEADLAVGIAGVLVGMELHRKLAIGALEIGVGRAAFDAQHLVIASLGHGRSPQPVSVSPRTIPTFPASREGRGYPRCAEVTFVQVTCAEAACGDVTSADVRGLPGHRLEHNSKVGPHAKPALAPHGARAVCCLTQTSCSSCRRRLR